MSRYTMMSTRAFEEERRHRMCRLGRAYPCYFGVLLKIHCQPHGRVLRPFDAEGQSFEASARQKSCIGIQAAAHHNHGAVIHSCVSIIHMFIFSLLISFANGNLRSFLAVSAVLVTMHPAMQSACPLMDFVIECTTMSAPSSRGFCSAGPKNVLSTQTGMPFDLASLQISGMSDIVTVGFAGVSR